MFVITLFLDPLTISLIMPRHLLDSLADCLQALLDLLFATLEIVHFQGVQVKLIGWHFVQKTTHVQPADANATYQKTNYRIATG